MVHLNIPLWTNLQMLPYLLLLALLLLRITLCFIGGQCWLKPPVRILIFVLVQSLLSNWRKIFLFSMVWLYIWLWINGLWFCLLILLNFERHCSVSCMYQLWVAILDARSWKLLFDIGFIDFHWAQICKSSALSVMFISDQSYKPRHVVDCSSYSHLLSVFLSRLR